ncbi:hypothetical protein BG005_009170 [Podila minutissima]|nr:hypothetical protein BG005_009170 [Podila minutissima]
MSSSNPTELPNELLYMIFKDLDTKAIHACSMTCTDWQPAAVREIWACRSITIGDRQSRGEFPGPGDWPAFSSFVGKLTIGTDLTHRTMAQYNPANLSKLQELHVMNHVCLATPTPNILPGSAPSDNKDNTPLHWLHHLAARNPGLKVLSLVSHSPFNVAIQAAAFKISNYFRRPTLKCLPLTSLKLRYFTLSAAEMANLLQFCPALERLELEHVRLEIGHSPQQKARLMTHAGQLQKLVLLQTLPTSWLVQILYGVRHLALKGSVHPATTTVFATQGIQWTLPRAEFNRLMLMMPQLKTVAIDRVGMDVPSNGDERPHRTVRTVYTTEGIEFGNHFVNAKELPYVHQNN